MNKGFLKNILIVFFATVAVFSILKYKSILNEKRELLNTLNQVKEQAFALEKQKQNLLQDIEKRKNLESKFRVNLKANKLKVVKLLAQDNKSQRILSELDSKVSSLKMDNAALKEQIRQVSIENEDLRVKLKSAEEPKIPNNEIKALNTIEEGNRGFLTKEGQSVSPAKVKIEVVPASKKE